MHTIDAPSPKELPRLVEVWEGVVRATHDFLDEADSLRFEDTLPDAPRGLGGAPPPSFEEAEALVLDDGTGSCAERRRATP